jgi:hypothetical protein
VVYVSPASPPSITNSVTVTGFAPGQTYYAAVYTFSGSGSTKVFNNVVGPGASGSLPDGVLIGIRASLEGGVPNGGVGQLLVEANYSGVFTEVNAATTSSGDTNVIKVNGGILTGVTNGTAPVTVTFGGFTNGASVQVRPPSFVDNFDVSHDYLANGVAGTAWDGWYAPAAGTNPIPGSPYVPLTLSGATIADANTSSNGNLTIVSAGDGWENNLAGGFFLFKYVPADFQMSVLINTNDFVSSIGTPNGQNAGPWAFNQPGIMARAYGIDTNTGNIGAPFGRVINGGNGEYWVSLVRFDEFNIGTYARRNINSAVTQNTQTDPADLNYWLLIKRTGTRFDFFKRLNVTDPWRRVPNNTTYTIPEFAGQPMQVGIAAGPFSGNAGAQRTVHFDTFMLDVGKANLKIASSGSNVLLTWVPTAGVSLQYSLLVSPTTWLPVTGTPIATNGALVTVSIPATNTTTFFRLVQ